MAQPDPGLAGVRWLNLDRRSTRSPPRPQQCGQHSLDEPRVARRTSSDGLFSSAGLFGDQFLVRLRLDGCDRRRLEHPDWSFAIALQCDDHAGKPLAGRTDPEQVGILRFASCFHCSVATLGGQPQPGELAYRDPHVCWRDALEVPGSQLHTTTRSHQGPTISTSASAARTQRRLILTAAICPGLLGLQSPVCRTLRLPALLVCDTFEQVID
jgi:hypothetical protein